MAEVKKMELVSVRLNYDFVAFGVNTSQLSGLMASIRMRVHGDRVIVTSPWFPGTEKHILPAGIKELTFKESE